ncbi:MULTISPECIES: helix-turn-helix domain-containing protein [unclassified Rhodococcus (in: high G+C Gram-positive bacteria)]|uniref:helix-turn-helix domain-containing protein n=1 Tax=unclassified Rhodococcus (in: high G+C Gram-positive bacteria) TaxID=192944 RepID=UPI0015951606|nr:MULTISPECIES: helix-turn-helix transcriptional regulator [unclassified Rhodococcus (in: high G+C Gram-positive bacteria)]
MKWNLRMVAAQRDIWRPTQLLKAFEQVDFHPSLSKTAALWSSAPVTIRLDDLDKICAALNCTVSDLMLAEAVHSVDLDAAPARAIGDRSGPAAPATGTRKRGARRVPPPN